MHAGAEGEKLISPLPFYHIYAFMLSMHASTYCGVPVVTMPRFDLEAYCSLVQKHRCTRTHLVPSVVSF
jgi:acyl-CoA synthetase (AMP-forming)/AMP-acid ligase II